MTPDDSALIHGRAPYDPAKAREYYLRTRKLKGRRTPRLVAPKGNGRPHAVPVHVKKSSRQAELKAERAALEKRLDRLRDILAKKVKAAKARSGVKAPEHKTSQQKAATKERGKNDKPLTASQKHEKAAKARADYKKEHGDSGKDTNVQQDIASLRKQIADIRARIDAAIKDAQANHKSTHQTASRGR